MEIEEKSRMLFMKYAVPCAGTLVNRGTITQKNLDILLGAVKNNKEIPKDSEKIFKVAFTACSLMAIDKKKKSIDSDVIRNYFLFNHDEVIDKRYEEMGDFDPHACRVRAGVVESVDNNFCIVSNSAGKKKYRTDYCKEIKKGDHVATHWDFVVEKIDKGTAEKINQQKKILKVV